ncbi:MAG: hypothetical protein WAN12_08995 [Candidatus Acidiferrum sp.]
MNAEPILLESHPPGIALVVLLAAMILFIIGLILFFLDYQKWPKRNRKMSRLRPRGFALLFVTALLWAHLIVYHPRLTPEQLKARPMLMEMRPGVRTQLEFLLAAASTICGIAIVLFDLQNWVKRRRVEKKSPNSDQHIL